MAKSTSVGIEQALNVSMVSVGKLVPFELQESYDHEPPADDFVEKIKTNGLTEPIVVTDDNVVISGWRRTQSFILLKRKKIPAVVRNDLSSHGMRLLAWTSANEHRDQTTAQKVVRYQAYSDAYSELAKEAMSKREKSTIPGGKTGAAAAKKSGLGARQTAERASFVVDFAATLAGKGMSTLSKELLDLLNNKSIASAYRRTLEIKQEIDEKENPPAKEKKKTTVSSKPNQKGFDERKIHEIAGKMVRILLDRAKMCKGKQKNAGYVTVEKNMNELLESIAAWRKSDPL